MIAIGKVSKLRRLLAVAFVASSALGFIFYQSVPSGHNPVLQSGMARSEYTLLDMQGRPFDLANLSGRPAAVFFGFTHCSDVCPMTLNRLALMQRKIGPAFDKIRVVFITVDPQRDTVEVLRDYLAAHAIPVTGLTGSLAGISKAAVQFGVFNQRVPVSENGYDVDHTASIFLLDPQGRQVGEIATNATDAELEAKLRKIL